LEKSATNALPTRFTSSPYSSFLALPTLFLEDIFVLEEYRRQDSARKCLMKLEKSLSAKDAAESNLAF